MSKLERIVRYYRHWHLSVAVTGNVLFFVGSVLFFPALAKWETLAVWMFVVGSALMLYGALCEVAKATYEKRDRH